MCTSAWRLLAKSGYLQRSRQAGVGLSDVSDALTAQQRQVPRIRRHLQGVMAMPRLRHVLRALKACTAASLASQSTLLLSS